MKKRDLVLWLLIGILVGVIITWILTRDTNHNNNKKSIAFTEIKDEILLGETKVKTNKKILTVEGISSTISGDFIVTSGVIKNNSEFICSDFRVLVDCLDEKGNVVDTDVAILLDFSNAISPNSYTTFQALSKISSDNLYAKEVKVYIENRYNISK